MQREQVRTSWLVGDTTVLVSHNPPNGLWCGYYLMYIDALGRNATMVCFSPTREGLLSTLTVRLVNV